MMKENPMYVQSPPSFVAGAAAFPSFAEPCGHSGGAVAVSRLVKSVVEEAGLGRFVYLKGRSGRRYIFSSIETRQVDLYRRALFVATRKDGSIKVCGDPALVNRDTGLYVHLLDDDEDAGAILKDLAEASAINA